MISKIETQNEVSHSSNSSPRLLIFIGLLWLLLGAGLLYNQFASPANVEITWETATEQNTAGFYLYRSTEPDGEFVIINENELIDSQGGPVSGASYTYFDDNVISGQKYYYLLEEIEYDSTRNRYEDDIFAYEVPKVSWWATILTAGSVIIGLALLVTGLKEDRNL